jgi:hypothetical protein
MKNNEFKKSYGFLGIGAFGGNITRAFELAGYPCVVANSSSEDLQQLKEAKNKLHFSGGIGCHKDRKKSKALLKENIEALVNEIRAKMPEVSTLFIFASSAGGTGSGMLAATAKILRNVLDINICIVTVIPSKSEQFKAYANTVELFQELERLDDIGAMFILDNEKYKDKLKINEIFFTHLNALLTNENGSERGCVDRGEVNELLRTKGIAIISKLGQDNSDTERLLASIKTNNIYAPPEKDRVIRYFCLMNSGCNISTEQIYSELGAPVDEFIGTGAPSTVCMAAGLSLPKARLNEIKKTAQASSEIIRKNLESAKESLFDGDTGFLGAYDVKPVVSEGQRKASSLEILSEFL